jgi:hypothetical protein
MLGYKSVVNGSGKNADSLIGNILKRLQLGAGCIYAGLPRLPGITADWKNKE